MNPYVIIGALVVWVASLLGAGYYSYDYGVSHTVAGEKKTEDLVRQVQDAAQQGAAAEIAKIKPVNTTIQQEVRHEIETHTVYRDCHVPADGLRLANDALTGQRAEPAGGGQLPAADAAAGRLDGSAAGQAGVDSQPVP